MSDLQRYPLDRSLIKIKIQKLIIFNCVFSLKEIKWEKMSRNTFLERKQQNCCYSDRILKGTKVCFAENGVTWNNVYSPFNTKYVWKEEEKEFTVPLILNMYERRRKRSSARRIILNLLQGELNINIQKNLQKCLTIHLVFIDGVL